MRADADRSAKPLTARRLALDDGAWLLAGFAAGTLAAELLHTLEGAVACITAAHNVDPHRADVRGHEQLRYRRLGQ